VDIPLSSYSMEVVLSIGSSGYFKALFLILSKGDEESWARFVVSLVL
jgi:hypothetical protein